MGVNSPVLVKLTPNRCLLNSDFETYKLSLNPLPRYEIELRQDNVVQRSKAVENDDFSLQFLSLQRMHNHVVADIWVSNAVAYIIDAGFRVVCCSEADMRKAGTEDVMKCRAVLPKPHDLEKLRYHPTLAFPSVDLAVVAAGNAYLWLFNTGNRTADNSSDDQWELLEEFDFSDFIKDGFMLKDAQYAKKGDEEIVSCLLVHVDVNCSEGKVLISEFESSSFVTIVDWVSLSRHSVEGAWEILRRRRFGGKHALLLAAIDKVDASEDALVLASEGSEFRMVFDSQGTVKALNGVDDESNGESPEPLYEWNQTADAVTVTMKLPATVKKEDVTVKIEPRRLHVEALVTASDSVPEKIGFAGELASVVKPDESTWTLTRQEGKTWAHLEIVLSTGGDAAGDGNSRPWKELIKACKRGRETVDPAVAAEVHERLAHLTSETLVSGLDQGPGVGINQLEECDGFPPESSTLVRFVCQPNGEYQVSHKASLSAHQFLFSSRLGPQSLPVACLRHDVDAIVWEFGETEPDNWGSVHRGTFDAFGYVFASKENRKYATCPPDLSYAVICDSKAHCYIYRKMSPLLTDLKNRKTGKHVPTVAKQFVLTLKHEEVLGVSASDQGLFLLTETGLSYVSLTGV